MSDNWESALRKLTRERPREGIDNAVIDEMRSSSADRPCALVSAALADMMLQLAITYSLAVKGQENVNQIFYGDGPLSSFDKKVTISSALAIVGPITLTNLKIIKNVRNVFAHALTNVTFDTPAVERACRLFKLSDNSSFLLSAETQRPNRFSYCLACNEIYQGILAFSIPRFLANEFNTRKLLDHPILP